MNARVACGLLVLGITASAVYATQPAKSAAAEVAAAMDQVANHQTDPPPFVANTETWVVTSDSTKRTYQISVALPHGYGTGSDSYPVLYAVDANLEFGTVVETARMLKMEGVVPDLVIVGIGYPVGDGVNAFAPRTLDLTPTADQTWVEGAAKYSLKAGWPVPEGSGGADGFLRFVREELIPSVEKKYGVSHDDRAFVGHSFGALFGAHALLDGRGTFSRFVLGSPSLWWGNGATFRDEDAHATKHHALKARVFLSVGALEESDGDADAAKLAMVTNVRKLAQVLSSRGYEGLQLKTHVFEGETHVSVGPAMISRGLRFIYDNAGGAAAATPAVAGATGRYANVRGLHMYYEVHGEGAPLVVLHGGTASIDQWPEVIEYFSKNYRVIAPEQMGHGHTADDPSRPFDYHEMAEDTAELLRQLEIHSAYFLGWSDGAQIGLDLAIHHPTLVKKLVTSGANIHTITDPQTIAWIKHVKAECGPGDKPMEDCVPPAGREAYVRIAPDPKHWPAFIERVKAMWLRELNITKVQLGKIQASTLVVAGDHDMTPTKETVEIFETIPGAALWIVPESTHFVPKERAKLFNETVDGFFGEPMPARP